MGRKTLLLVAVLFLLHDIALALKIDDDTKRDRARTAQLDLFLTKLNVLKKEDKAKWLKEYFKGHTLRLNQRQQSRTTLSEKEKAFKRKFVEAFISQTNIEHLEPVAFGTNTVDSKIAEFNTSCPDEKPMDVTASWVERAQKYKGSTPKCVNMRIYQFDAFNAKNGKHDYVLSCYCLNEYNSYQVTYLQTFPKQCSYSKQLNILNGIGGTQSPEKEEQLTGIFKYLGNYYFYVINDWPFDGSERLFITELKGEKVTSDSYDIVSIKNYTKSNIREFRNKAFTTINCSNGEERRKWLKEFLNGRSVNFNEDDFRNKNMPEAVKSFKHQFAKDFKSQTNKST